MSTADCMAGKAVQSFFTPASKKSADMLTWRIHEESLIIGRYGSLPLDANPETRRRKVAAFDLVSLFDRTHL